MDFPENIDINMDFPENIDINMDFPENIYIGMGVLRIINMDKILYRQGFGKSNTARVKRGPDCQSLFYELFVQKIIKGRRMYLENISNLGNLFVRVRILRENKICLFWEGAV